MKYYLPIGSIVLLKGGTKKVMICGRIQEHIEQHKIYDYCACLYPEGILDPEQMYLFQDEDIDKVFFIGMQDEEEFAFRELLEEHKKMKPQG